MWDRVEHAYNSKEERGKRHMGSMPVRDVDAIRSKWKALKNNKKPTGDPDCPKEVRRAKRIAWEIETGAGVFVEDDDDDADSEDETGSGSEENSDSDNSSVHSEVMSRPALISRVVPETLMPIEISSSISVSEHHDRSMSQGAAVDVPDAQTLSPIPSVDQNEAILGDNTAKGAQRSKKYSVPDRLGMTVDELQALATRLRGDEKSKKKIEKKKNVHGQKSQDPAKVPANPGYSKKRVLQNELKEADEAFVNNMREHERQLAAAQKAAERQHQEKMRRLELQSEQVERRYQEEMAARRQENLLSERRHQADADRSNILFSAIMMGIASVSGLSQNPQFVHAMQVLARPGAGEAQPHPNNP
jgi:hypothetical protein